MKNTISFQSVPRGSFPYNQIHVDKLLFYLKKEQAKNSPTLRTTAKTVPADLLDKVKTYLSNNYRELLRDSFGDEQKKQALLEVISSFISNEQHFTDYEDVFQNYTLEKLSEDLTEAIAGLGILKELITDTTTDIMINDWNDIWIEDLVKGSYRSEKHFDSIEDYQNLCNRLVYASSKRFTHTKPYVNAIFPNMRVNIVGFDIAKGKYNTAIRIISKKLRITREKMIEDGYATPEMIDFLELVMKTRLNTIVTGQTGAGKTELIRYLTGYINPLESIILIEDTPESYLKELYAYLKNIKEWLTREPDDEGKHGVDYNILIQQAVRQNPDWIMIQECRGSEAYHMLKAGETDHGLLTTLHAKNSILAIDRLITLCQEAYPNSDSFYGKRITDVFDIGIHLEKENGKRRITQIVEYQGFKDNEPIVNILFEYDRFQRKHIAVGKLSQELYMKLSTKNASVNVIDSITPKIPVTL